MNGDEHGSDGDFSRYQRNLNAFQEDEILIKTLNDSNFERKTSTSRSKSTPSPKRNINFQMAVSEYPWNENNKPNRKRSPPGGDTLLQWGQNKRSRRSRAEKRVTESNSLVQTRHSFDSKKGTVGTILNYTPFFNVSSTRGANFRPSKPVGELTGSSLIRNPEDQTSRVSLRSTDKRSPPTPDNSNQCSKTPETETMNHETQTPSEREPSSVTEKINLELFEWPRIYISLSRKEKEEDFLIMKGGKLPQRPKKRPKNIDKILQYCFPGMWLSDLSSSRYEVREKKCVRKQKWRGLKGMESETE